MAVKTVFKKNVWKVITLLPPQLTPCKKEKLNTDANEELLIRL